MAIEVKAIACELPSRLDLPLSRLFVPDIKAEVIRRGIVASISGSTIWRWLDNDAIRPWTFRSWIFPRDPAFEAKAVHHNNTRIGDGFGVERRGLEDMRIAVRPDETAETLYYRASGLSWAMNAHKRRRLANA